MAARKNTPEMTRGEAMAQTLASVRAQRIREARNRVPAPTMEQIAMEVGCSLKTVWNVLHERTHVGTG